jgi:hypothetical protein
MTLAEQARVIAKGIVPLGDVFECDIPLVIAGMRAALELARPQVSTERPRRELLHGGRPVFRTGGEAMIRPCSWCLTGEDHVAHGSLWDVIQPGEEGCGVAECENYESEIFSCGLCAWHCLHGPRLGLLRPSKGALSNESIRT